MFFDYLKLTNFRNYPECDFHWQSGLNVVLGPNGSGKTNLLEAIHLLFCGNSFRGVKNEQMIHYSQREAVIFGRLKEEKQIVDLAISLKNNSKKLFLRGKDSSLEERLSLLPIVSFVPQDLMLLIGSPGQRRRFLDQILIYLSADYAYLNKQFRRILIQRNRLLQDRAFDLDQIIIWEDPFIKASSKMIEARQRMVIGLNKILEPQRIKLFYRPSPRFLSLELGESSVWEESSVRKLFADKLNSLREKEISLGFSLIGPQRDDLTFYGEIDQSGVMRDLKFFGSRGQQRMAVIYLKKAQLQLLFQKFGQNPLFLLDDVFSELDQKNQSILLPDLDKQQSILTATDSSLWSDYDYHQVFLPNI